jgi:hypothetical protein
MHIFLYKAARHSTDKWGNRNRYKQNTKRGDFNLNLLKKSIGGRYTIVPHSEYAFQKALEGVDLQEEFYGHIIAIPEGRDAVWLKLNYDHIGTATTKYVGAWRDLDPEAITVHVEAYKKAKAEYATIYALANSVRYQVSRADDFIGHMGRIDPSVHDMTDCKVASSEFRDAIYKVHRDLSDKIDIYRNKMVAEQQAVKDYIATRKF